MLSRKLFCVTLSILFIISGCTLYPVVEPATHHDKQAKDPTDFGASGEENNDDTSTETSDTTPIIPDETPLPETHDSVNSMMDSMTTEEKVAQLFVLDFYTMTNDYTTQNYTETMDTFLSTYPIGGVIYFGDNIQTRDAVIALNDALNRKLAIPPFISVDEEGGLVARLGKKDIGVTHLDNATTLQETMTLDELTAAATSLGEQMAELGFNMDYAPVLDVNTNPDNPVIGTRAFSSDPQVAADYATAFMTGLMNAGIIPVGKHFPGHGDTSTDSHLGLASIDKTLEELQAVEWVPFKEAINKDIPALMMGHINVPNVTGDDVTASMSQAMITTYLRETLGFDGLVITDSLRMQAITDYYTPEEVGVMLLKAGGDLILMPEDFKATYQGILDALDNGTLTMERLDQSVRRVLETKKNNNILNF